MQMHVHCALKYFKSNYILTKVLYLNNFVKSSTLLFESVSCFKCFHIFNFSSLDYDLLPESIMCTSILFKKFNIKRLYST